MNRIEAAMSLIKKHEGLRLHIYSDSRGTPTIGYGRNLRDHGISLNEADTLLSHDIEAVDRALGEHTWYRNLCFKRQAVMLDMAINLGVNGLLEFRSMIQALTEGDFNAAADAMLASRWAAEVGLRAREDATIIRGV